MSAHKRFLELFLKQERDLKAFILSAVRDWDLAEDIFQEVALVLWEKFGEYDEAHPFGAWARGIAINKVKKAFERTRQATLLFSIPSLEALNLAFQETETERPRHEALRECLHLLGEQGRRLLALRYEEGLPLEEIARRLGRTLFGVTKALSRLRKTLEECISQRVPPPRARS